MIHETPDSVANVLARHLPRNVTSILDPAVGTGALLRPAVRRLRSSLRRIVCVDTDPVVLQEAAGIAGKSGRAAVETVNGDFLRWASSNSFERFDCIVMNPPFGARKEAWRVPNEVGFPSLPAKIPLEAAFAIASIRLLRTGGTLLAILPSSIVSAFSARWLRQLLFSHGHCNYIHELPPATFPNVDGRVYVVAYVHGGRGRSVRLLNHDLHLPTSLSLPIGLAKAGERLDFGYHETQSLIQGTQERHPSLGWTQLGCVCDIFRGSARSPEGKGYAVHTSDAEGPFWVVSKRHCRTRRDARRLQREDLLMRRVGRNCGSSLGIYVGRGNVSCTDCVLCLRPKPERDAESVLFAGRVVLGHGQISRSLERGIGASYVTQAGLGAIQLPSRLAIAYPSQFRCYRRAIRQRNAKELAKIESNVRSLLFSIAK